MGIFGALTTAISGLRAQSFALEQISGNIANSQTVGYKRNETSFVDLVNDAPPERHVAGAVDAFTRSTNTVGGDIGNSTVETHMGISGDGYFIIEESAGTADGVPLFTGVNFYTRRGDFELDRNGFLKNGAGYFLKGLELDPTTGNVTGSLPSVIRITNDFLPARATTTIDYRANLAAFPRPPTANPLQPGTELLQGPFAANPTTQPINIPATSTGSSVIINDSPAAVTGTTATLQPDQSAIEIGTGTFNTSLAAGSFTVNGVTVNFAQNDTIATVRAAINTALAGTGVSASDNGTVLTLTAANADTPIALGGSDLAAVGLDTTNSTAQRNLFTQGTVTAGQTLTVRAGTGAIQTITFGNGSGEVSTLAELNTALGGLASINGSVNIADGNISLSATNNTDDLVVGGTASLADFGLTAGTITPINAQIAGFTGILSVAVGSGAPQTIDLSSITNRRDLSTALSGLTGVTATINGANQVQMTATNNSDALTITGSGATELGINSASPTPGAPPVGFVRNDETSIFLDQTIAGGAVTVFDPVGSPVNVQFRWGKISDSPATWNLFYLENSNPATAADAVWRNVGVDYTFAANGQLTSPTNNPTINNLTVNGVNLGNIVLNHGQNGLSQFADPNGVARVTEIDQNGFAAGELVGVSLGENGRVLATYTNGEALAVAQVVLASFNGDNALRKLDGGAFAETEQSGPALLGAQGTILGQSLEGSNTDIADEFTKLIVTQQAYSAGTRIITTGNEMLQEVLNIIR